MTAEAPPVGSPAPCPRHRGVETYLRCSRCGTPICPKCLVHTPVGARCPDCAKPTARVGPGLLLYLRGSAAGLGVAMLSGAVLSFLHFGALTLLPLLLTGFLVGEAVSSAGRRWPDRKLAMIAFACASVGPSLGQALVYAVMMPIPDPGVRIVVALTAAMQSLGMFGILIAMISGVIASTRVTR